MGDVAVLLTVARGAAAGNSIGDAGAAAIADALKVNKTVTKIDLDGAYRVARGAGGSVGGVAFVLLTGARCAAGRRQTTRSAPRARRLSRRR